ncbi:23S rRNA (pseudouridine(1915)-N(3))-methyltransferase RlmH [Pollutibacter soli]|uniref:23S rRNA (pseudouridine(1915)-N(3))-methyltransferase RlmH n=1 Tax=Pollutibacter soli TaxID=3034157 RepID=UPI003013E6B2
MKIQCWTIGKNNEAYVSPGIEDFTKRINRYYPFQWVIIAPPKNAASMTSEELKKQESKLLLDRLTKEDYLVALDENGRQMDSVTLADFVQKRANENCRQMIFLIGGAFGIHESLIARADYKWSLSALTFPHQLVRLILAEQVYRACTIQRNEKYHHS